MIETNEEKKLLQILDRSVLAMSLYELWVSAPTYQQFFDQMKLCPEIYSNEYARTSFNIIVETFGKKISLQTKVEKIETLHFLPFKGPIKLKDPDFSFHYFEYYDYDGKTIPIVPIQIIFGKWICDSNRKMVSKFSLKKRKFISNTSMDAELSLVMSNVAKVTNGDIVYDPFVGSGSLLVSSAYHGGYVCGTDIDYLLMYGLTKPTRCGVKKREKDESVYANLKQYNLHSRYLDILCADSSLPLIRDNFKFDAIITDPPYGKRESRERVGTNKNYKIPEELVPNHIPSKLEYKMEDIYRDLLDLAVKHLKPNGRILFWVPYSKSSEFANPWKINFVREKPVDYFEEELKEKFSHSKLEWISYAEQSLTSNYSRILIAMQLGNNKEQN